jgi:histidine ammonia-lyase
METHKLKAAEIADVRITVGGNDIDLDGIYAVATGSAKVDISSSPEFIKKIERSRTQLTAALEKGVPVYGVTTGFGKSCSKRLSMKTALDNGDHLLRFHGCGTGEPFGIEETRAAMFCRLLCLARGYSGVSLELLKQMADFLNCGITPIVPCEGSVGASGDLTPMSYIAACLNGQRNVFYKGRKTTAAAALKDAGLQPYKFKPKEPISLVNGTSVMTGVAVIAAVRARRIADAAICATALSIHALRGKSLHFHPTIFNAKPHAGQAEVAAKLRHLLESNGSAAALEADAPETLQDPYSIRCAPHMLGVLVDSLQWISEWVRIEANSANDNPLLEPQTGEVLTTGNFYGGHIAFAMDALKMALASAADMSDRQVAIMVNSHVNRGLPADLVLLQDERRLFNHGFKALSISSSALTAEALKLTMPAGSFSRSTESHNQDKVSMGTIAARDAARLCELVERTTAIHLLAAAQGCDARQDIETRPALVAVHKAVRGLSAAVQEDRPLDGDINRIADVIANTDLFSLKNA